VLGVFVAFFCVFDAANLSFSYYITLHICNPITFEHLIIVDVSGGEVSTGATKRKVGVWVVVRKGAYVREVAGVWCGF